MRVLNGINDTLCVAYKWLAGNQLTESQLKQRLELALIGNPAKNDLVYETMESLRKANLLHDEWMAEKIARRYSHLSNAHILKKLLAKGLEEKLAHAAIKNLIPESIRAKRLAEQKITELAFESSTTRRAKVKHYLESRGFSDSLSSEVMLDQPVF